MQVPSRQDPNFQQKYLEYIQEIRQKVSNILYDPDVFKNIVKAYDNGDKVQVVARAVVMILEKVVADVGTLDMPTLYAVGLLISNDIGVDMMATGREDLTKEQASQMTTLAIRLYTERHPDQVDPNIAASMFKQMEQDAKSGAFDQINSVIRNDNSQQPQQPQQPQGVENGGVA